MRCTDSVDLFGKLGVEFHIEIPHQMIPLLAAAFRGNAFTETLVSKHGFADVDTPVVDQIDLHHIVTDALEERSQSHTQSVVADMAQMLRLVGVGS